MKHFLLAITAIFFGLTISAQELEKTTDSISNQIEEKTNPINVAEIVDYKINDWQLYEYTIYEKYPDSIQAKKEFTKGKEFISLGKNGEYVSILNNTFKKVYGFRIIIF
ncbi:hypothetical protein [Winogradskyella haliclonae]|uniref:Uncharacterized protein n=1 Tax=Winogradskyella haliclonae TaxID=2048558 RepID=A0ABQ2BVX7_9FLAO|nr:hypothetical protein [Winogradskyella haliclonae]GGI56644.1 hypothetical protein GCM10011444_09530 [Winogradskyella haliclonae]